MKSNFHDIISFLSTLTWFKFLNLFKNKCSYWISSIIKKDIVWGLPSFASIETTNKCNLSCPECSSGINQISRIKGFIAFDFYKKVLNQSAKHLSHLFLYFQGEPYLHPELYSIIKFAWNKKIYTSISTNAQFLTSEAAKKTVESGLNRLIISIDGSTQEIYSSYRKGGSLNKVLSGTKLINTWKNELNSKTPYLVMQLVVTKENQHQIEDIKRIGKELQVDKVEIKSAQINDFENGNSLIPTIDKYARYKKRGPKFTIKNKLKNKCWRLWSTIVITWDGKVATCCFDKDCKYKMGDLNSNSISSIWKENAFSSFRKNILKSRKSIDICQNCTEGLKI